MKLKIIGDKENNVIKQIRRREIREEEECCMKMCDLDMDMDCMDMCYSNGCDFDFSLYDNYNCCAAKKECFIEKKECCMNDDDEDMDDDEPEEKREAEYLENNNKKKEKDELIENKKEKKLELNNKENIMKMINTQDFIDGFWEENEYTKIIKEKYQKEFDLLKGLKNKNINDKTALTILVLYFINKEHPELLPDLIMIIKKGKIFIQKETKDNYENIIKEICLN